MHNIAKNLTMNNKSYKQTLEFLFSQLPMYQRVGKMAYKANLDTTLALDEYFKHPHQQYKTIHVAGTNGKGSTSHMLTSVLMQAGYKVGLYTSPHLKSFRERIRVDGQMVSENFVVEFTHEHMHIFQQLEASFFEMTVAMAFEYFALQKVDIAVVETGLGGRLDSTNIITPEVSIITNIGNDHSDLLGDTPEKIAVEKAGIIKQGVPTIIGQAQSNLQHIFKEKANEVGATIIYADEMFSVSKEIPNNPNKQTFLVTQKRDLTTQTLSLDLLGNYQQKNLLSVLTATEVLTQKGFTISQENVAVGLAQTAHKTGLLGRWQILNNQPLTICDTGHNEDGMNLIVEQIKQTPHQKLHFIIGMVADKTIDTILNILPKDAMYYFTRPSIPRALNEKELFLKGKEHGLSGNTYPTVEKAMEEAKKTATSNDLIFIGGSTFVVADALGQE